MSIAKPVTRWVRIVPLRFARAPHATDPTVTTGTFDGDAPDPDDRGFLPRGASGAVLPVGLDAAVALAARPEARVRLVREEIENASPLALTTDVAGIIELSLPAGGAALPSAKHMMIKFRAVAAGTTHLQVRLGDAAGPILHQLEIVVNPLLRVRVAAHVPTLNGPPSVPPFPATGVRSDANIRTLFQTVNVIYKPYGLQFVVDAVVDRAGVLNGLQNRGMVDDLSNEFNLCTNLNRVAGTVNAYFVPQIANTQVDGAGNPVNPINATAGVATSARTDPANFGLFVADWAASGQVVAHELGHLLNIVNDPSGSFLHINTSPDPASPGTGREVRDDLVSRRRLMFAFTNLLPDASIVAGAAPALPRLGGGPYRDDVGYGAGQPGGMLTIKQLTNDTSDLEMREVQRTAATLQRPPGP